jgi:deoxyadenosine/deoxycytidine kinase
MIVSVSAFYHLTSVLTMFVMPKLKVPSDHFCICVEGLIGSGKSTLVEALGQHPSVTSFPEDLGLWTSLPGAGGDPAMNMLKLYYDDMGRWGGTFQLMVGQSKLEQHVAPVSTAVKVIEGSLSTSFGVYSLGNLRAGHLSSPEAAVYQRMFLFAAGHHDIGAHKTIFLDVSVDVALARIKARGREEESGITADYLENLSSNYSKFFSDPNLAPYVTVIKADGQPAEVLEQVKENLKFLLGEW